MTQVSKYATPAGARRPRTPRQAARRAGPLDRALNAGFFKALSDPTRLRLVACVAKCGRMCSVTEVAECCSVDFSVVSRHLAMLADAGVLESRKDGRTMSYQVRSEYLSNLFRALADAFESCCPEKSCCEKQS
jgi:ArsR family transcriptional regulator